MNGWPGVITWDTYLYPASGVSITPITLLGRWTWHLVRPLEVRR